MSSQAFIFNPREDRLAAAGTGFQIPRLTTGQRTALTVSVGDAGMMVFDLEDAQFYGWSGSAWSALSDVLLPNVTQTAVTVNGNDVTVVAGAAPGVLYREIVIQNRGIYPVFIRYGAGADSTAANGELVLAGGYLPDDGTGGTLNVDGWLGSLTAAATAASNLSVVILQ